MARYDGMSAALAFVVWVPAFATASLPAVADIVPESVRIQQNAKKAYSQKPVVPINRGNAHRRDLGGTGGGDGGSSGRASPALPDPTIPPSYDPKGGTPR